VNEQLRSLLWEFAAAIKSGFGPCPRQRPDERDSPGEAELWDAIDNLTEEIGRDRAAVAAMTRPLARRQG
jgi:methylphosphotriester-DNA--protein-cysteine methyltransferase